MTERSENAERLTSGMVGRFEESSLSPTEPGDRAAVMAAQAVSDFEAQFGCKLEVDWILSNVGPHESVASILAKILSCDLRKAVRSDFLYRLSQTGNGAIEIIPHLLQIDEIVDVSVPVTESYTYHAGGTRKVALTDGSTRFIGFEIQPTMELTGKPPGTKVTLDRILLQEGMMLIFPGAIKFLGGAVQELVAAMNRAKQRLVKSKYSYP